MQRYTISILNHNISDKISHSLPDMACNLSALLVCQSNKSASQPKPGENCYLQVEVNFPLCFARKARKNMQNQPLIAIILHFITTFSITQLGMRKFPHHIYYPWRSAYITALSPWLLTLYLFTLLFLSFLTRKQQQVNHNKHMSNHFLPVKPMWLSCFNTLAIQS